MDLPECSRCGIKQKRENAKFCYKCGHQEFRSTKGDPPPAQLDPAGLDYDALIADTLSEISSGTTFN